MELTFQSKLANKSKHEHTYVNCGRKKKAEDKDYQAKDVMSTGCIYTTDELLCSTSETNDG